MPPTRPNLGRSIAAALDDSATLKGLLAGHRRAQACMVAARPALPPALRAQVRAGPIEAGVWTVFVAGSAAAAKLRHCLPNLLQAVQALEPQITEIRVKVASPPP